MCLQHRLEQVALAHWGPWLKQHYFLPCGKYTVVVGLECQEKELWEDVSMQTMREEEEEINTVFAEALQS